MIWGWLMGKIGRSWRPKEKKAPEVVAPKLIPLGAATSPNDAQAVQAGGVEGFIRANMLSEPKPMPTSDQFESFLKIAFEPIGPIASHLAKKRAMGMFWARASPSPEPAPGLVLEVVDGVLRYGCDDDMWLAAEMPFAAIERHQSMDSAYLYGCGRVWLLHWTGSTPEEFAESATLELWRA